ncbi:MAG: hypothetical protein KA714_10650 [Limnoraphis sp. WC205]|jgi:hypothetical protein|nr:hypothetical protein [Limnoraphis sp. WC205]
MTKITIQCGERQLVLTFDEDLLTEEMIDLAKINSIAVEQLNLKEAVCQLELLRDDPFLYELEEENIA